MGSVRAEARRDLAQRLWRNKAAKCETKRGKCGNARAKTQAYRGEWEIETTAQRLISQVTFSGAPCLTMVHAQAECQKLSALIARPAVSQSPKICRRLASILERDCLLARKEGETSSSQVCQMSALAGSRLIITCTSKQAMLSRGRYWFVPRAAMPCMYIQYT
jgi:hypothetical protein